VELEVVVVEPEEPDVTGTPVGVGTDVPVAEPGLELEPEVEVELDVPTLVLGPPGGAGRPEPASCGAVNFCLKGSLAGRPRSRFW
jgi:hypothetical protein